MNQDATVPALTPAPLVSPCREINHDADALEALRAGLRRHFAALGPDEAAAFDALLAEGDL